jgi:lipoate synthase
LGGPQPSKRHMSVSRMLAPAEFESWREEGLALGFK